MSEPLPTLVEPDDQPLVIDPSDEPLVTIDHERILCLGSYVEAGWTGACEDTLLRRSVAERVGAVADALPARYGLAIYDAWRPMDLQIELYEAAYADPELPPGFVAEPSADPATPPPHLTGGAVDLTLTIDGTPLSLGTAFDDFTELAHADSLEGEAGPDREHRRMLYWGMWAQGFIVLDCEWWHYEWGTRRWSAIRGGRPRYGAASP